MFLLQILWSLDSASTQSADRHAGGTTDKRAPETEVPLRLKRRSADLAGGPANEAGGLRPQRRKAGLRKEGEEEEEEEGAGGRRRAEEGGGRGAESGREERGGEEGGGQEDAGTVGREEGRGCGGSTRLPEEARDSAKYQWLRRGAEYLFLSVYS